MSRMSFVLAAFAGLCIAGIAAAQAPPDVRPEFLVNTHTPGSQSAPVVAPVASGGFWTVWREEDEAPGGLKARRFSASGAPLGPEIWVHPVPEVYAGPRIAAQGDGFVLAWSTGPAVWARRFGADGAPLADKVQVAAAGITGLIGSVDVAAFPDGSYVVGWVRADTFGDAVLAQRFGAGDQRVGGIQEVAAKSRNTLFDLDLAAGADGSYVTVWHDLPQLGVDARRFDGPSGAWSEAVRVDGTRAGFDSDPVAALAADGSAVVAWRSEDAVLARRLTAAGAVSGPEVEVGPRPAFGMAPALALDAAGDALVAWSTWNGELWGRLLDPGLSPLSAAFRAADPAFPSVVPAAAATAAGDFALVWQSGVVFHTPVLPPPPVPGRDGSFEGIAARVFGPARCAAGSETLCLADGRFEARVTWKTPDGATGTGRSLPLTGDTGAFWFFGPENLELIVKVLDGTAVNQRFWVYAGALSNVEYTLTVRDTATGAERTYHNAPRELASRADVAAFPATPPGPAPALTVTPVAGPAPSILCPAGGETLCLAGERFQVEVAFTDPRTGATGAGQALPLTADTGAFWFFDPSNLELMIKVLDGRAVNGHFWVFWGALSDVDYTITVVDSVTGARKSYHNPRGTLASRADVGAF